MALRFHLLVVAVASMFCSSPLFAGDAVPAACELNVRERYEFYEINGTSVDDLRRQMKQNGTKGEDGLTYSGLTTWDIRYVYQINSDSGRYSVKSAKTKVDIVYRLPRLVQPVTDPALAAVWNQYFARLQVHEFGHKDLAVKIASEINDVFSSLSTYSDADELDEVIKRRTAEKFAHLKETQVDYDHVTRHGETQGVVLPNGSLLASADPLIKPQ